MPNQHKHSNHGSRDISRDSWKKFGTNAGRADSTRSKLLAVFVDWFNNEPGAELPERPPPLPPEAAAAKRAGDPDPSAP